MAFWNENATPPITARSRAEFAAFFDGLDLLEPGVVSCSRWRSADRRTPTWWRSSARWAASRKRGRRVGPERRRARHPSPRAA